MIKSKISKNNFKLPKDSDDVKHQSPRINIDDKLLNRLREACGVRSVLTKRVFEGEWTGVPECFVTKDCTPYHNTKSKILDCLGDTQVPGPIESEALVVDLSVITRSQASIIKCGSTFNDLGDAVIRNITKTASACGASRLDMVLDIYNKQLSVKYPTRCDRKSKGFGHQISFQGSTIIPNDINKSFLSDEENKTKLNELIVRRFLDTASVAWGRKFCITNNLKNVYTDEGIKPKKYTHLI